MWVSLSRERMKIQVQQKYVLMTLEMLDTLFDIKNWKIFSCWFFLVQNWQKTQIIVTRKCT